jgi:two-component system, sensor histidine kinase and response regulator
MSFIAPPELLAYLDLLVLERSGPEQLELASPATSWWAKLGGGQEFKAAEIEPGEPLSFLAHFLEDAEDAWAEGAESRADSGMWVEEDEQGVEWYFEASARTFQGRRLLVVTSLGPDGDDRRRLLQTVRKHDLHHIEDIRQRELLREQLEHAKDRAEELNRAKSDFLANMSHEIRTPMSAVMGLTDLMLQTRVDAEQTEYLELIKESATSLLTLIDDILDLSKIEAGGIVLDEHPFNLRRLLADVTGTLAVRAHGKDVELNYCIDTSVPSHLVGDDLRLKQVVVNLLGNAIKFTDEGGVNLRVDWADESENRLRFRIVDSGGGIPPEAQNRIFEAFQQAHEGVVRSHGGTGLGLAISAQLVRMMGGHLAVKSDVGLGSVFYFDIPVSVKDPSTTSDAPEKRPRRVLVVDDWEDSREATMEIMAGWGVCAESTSTHATAEAMLQESADSGDPVDFLILSSATPKMVDMRWATDMVSNFDGLRVCVTFSTTQRGFVSRWMDLGIGCYLIKPVGPEKLAQAIASPNRLDAAQSRSEHVIEVASVPLKVLLAEDDAVNQLIAMTLLTKMGHTVSPVENGQAAIDALLREADFDVVLMDVQMPVLDGFSATQEIRKREALQGTRIPIIALTAHAMKGDRERCLEAGMDDYLKKPLRPQDLAAALFAVTKPDTERPTVEKQ